MGKPKGFLKKHVLRKGGDYSTPGLGINPEYLNPEERKKYDEEMKQKREEREQAIINTYGNLENYRQTKEDEKEQKRKEAEEKPLKNQGVNKIPEFNRYGDPEPTFIIGEDGIARQRK
jgi:hypothetical protein